MPQKKLNNLIMQKTKLSKELKEHADIVKGSVTKIARLCGNPNCKCATKNQKHINLFLSLKISGKTTLIYVPKQLEHLVKIWSINYKRLMKLVNKISTVNVKILNIKRKQIIRH